MDIRKEAGKKADVLTKKLGFDVRFYGKTVSLYSISYITTLLRGIASSYLVTLWLAPELLGQFRYVITLYGLAGIFSFGGYGSSIVKGLARGETNAVKNAFKKIIRYAPLGSAVLIFAALDRFGKQEPSVGIALLIAAVSFIPYTLCSFYTQIYTGLEKIKKLTITSIISDILYALLFIIILLQTHNLIILTLAYFIIDIAIQGWFTWKAYRSIPPSTNSDTQETYESLGRHINGIYIVQGIAMAIGPILLQRFWGYTAFAVFSIAMLIPEQLISLTKSMSGTILQRLSRNREHEPALKNIQRQFKHALIGSAGIVVLYAIIAPFALPILFPKYPDIVLPSIIYSLCILIIPSIIGWNYMLAKHNLKQLWFYSIFTSILQLLTSIILVPLLGNWGMIWSRVATRIGSLPISYPMRSSNEKITRD